MKPINRHCLLLLLLAGWAGAGLEARDIYRWTDSEGVVHFSDERPTEAVEDLRRLEMEAGPSAASDEDVFNVEATAERTRALREDMAQRREKQREQRMALERIEAQRRVVHYHQPAVSGRYWWRPPGYLPPVQPQPPLLPETPSPYPPSVPIIWPGSGD